MKQGMEGSQESSPLLRGLPPILPAGPIRALVLGSFPSVASLASEQYYGNPHNWFWRVLAACGVIASEAAPYAERIEAVRECGLPSGTCTAPCAGPDRGTTPSMTRSRILSPRCTASAVPFPILLNGRRGREWRRHFAALGVEPVALPSTSPRPLHWNTPEARAAAFAEWCAALRAAGVATTSDPVP